MKEELPPHVILHCKKMFINLYYYDAIHVLGPVPLMEPFVRLHPDVILKHRLAQGGASFDRFKGHFDRFSAHLSSDPCGGVSGGAGAFSPLPSGQSTSRISKRASAVPQVHPQFSFLTTRCH